MKWSQEQAALDQQWVVILHVVHALVVVSNIFTSHIVRVVLLGVHTRRGSEYEY